MPLTSGVVSAPISISGTGRNPRESGLESKETGGDLTVRTKQVHYHGE